MSFDAGFIDATKDHCRRGGHGAGILQPQTLASGGEGDGRAACGSGARFAAEEAAADGASDGNLAPATPLVPAGSDGRASARPVTSPQGTLTMQGTKKREPARKLRLNRRLCRLPAQVGLVQQGHLDCLKCWL